MANDGSKVAPGLLPASFPRGMALLRDPTLNKSTAFTKAERDALGLTGLLPPHVSTQASQSHAYSRTSGASPTIWSGSSTSRRCTTATRRCSSGWSSTIPTR